MDFTKGQRVHVLKSHNERRYGADPFVEGTVVRTGRKYVYVTYSGWGSRETQFDANGHEVTNYTGSARQIMTDDQRAQYERARDVTRRFRDLGLSSVCYDLSRKFPAGVIESVIGILEASTHGEEG